MPKRYDRGQVSMMAALIASGGKPVKAAVETAIAIIDEVDQRCPDPPYERPKPTGIPGPGEPRS